MTTGVAARPGTRMVTLPRRGVWIAGLPSAPACIGFSMHTKVPKVDSQAVATKPPLVAIGQPPVAAARIWAQKARKVGSVATCAEGYAK